MAPPTFSVIIPAHHRAEYLPSSVASVLGQTLPRSEFEILVVKNFARPEIDRVLADQGVRLLETSQQPLGGKLAEAIAASRGRILTFLEDDDLYAPDRLAQVRSAFEDPELGYFHNATQLIDRNGASASGRFRAESRRDLRVAARDRSFAAVRRLLRASAYFNLSSVAIRRDALAPALPHLGPTNLTCDNLLFYSALVSPFGLQNDARPFTYYRLHASASWTEAEGPDFFEREARKWEGIVTGFERILSMTRGTPVERFARGDLLERKALYALAASPEEAPFPGRDLPRLLGRRLSGDAEIAVAPAVAGLLLRSVAPVLERRLYLRHALRRASRLGLA
jgi:glycosyltransferase involved in cell wall biosynthesis